MGRYHANLMRDPERVEYLGGALHRVPVGCRSHNDSDQGFHGVSLPKPTRAADAETRKVPWRRPVSVVPSALSRPFPAVWPELPGRLADTPAAARRAPCRAPTAAGRASARSVGNAESPGRGFAAAPPGWRAPAPDRYRASACRCTAVAGSAPRERVAAVSLAARRTGCP